MSWREYEEGCPGCRPALLDLKTGHPLPDETPLLRAVLALWAAQSHEVRRAFHDVMCNNSRRPADLAAICPFMAAVEAAMAKERS